MKHPKTEFVALFAMLLLPALAMAGSDIYLQIKGADGKARVVHCPDGACVVAPIASGTYSVLVCDAQGRVIPTDANLLVAVVSPRDAASGQASGKRMHKPLPIRKEWDRGSKPGNVIAIDEAGVQLAIGISDEAVAAARAKITKSRSNIQNN